VPANTAALILEPKSGEDPTTCTAYSLPFLINGVKVERGVISYYAARCLAQATTVADWLAKIKAMFHADVERRLIRPEALSLTVTGSGQQRLAGQPLAAMSR
jgi:hypothetical protein